MIDSLATIQNLGNNPRTVPSASEDSQSSATMQMDDFLQLLTSQISNQDPLEPMKDTEFISQMANIASLEQMQQFSKGFEMFASSHKDMVAQAYLGRAVEIKSGSEELSGIVSAVDRSEDGKISVLVNNKAYDPNEIVKVSLASE